MKFFDSIFGPKVNGVHVIPLVLKIITVFTVFILVSNISTNYINLVLNRGELIKLAKRNLVLELKDIYSFAGSQLDIAVYNQDEAGAYETIAQKASTSFLTGYAWSLAFGVHDEDGRFLFLASPTPIAETVLLDENALALLRDQSSPPEERQGDFIFRVGGREYFGVYKYLERYDVFIVRAEELNEFYAPTRTIFFWVSVIIVGITLFMTLLGAFIIRFLLRFVGHITQGIMKMQSDMQLGLLDMNGAANDEVTYLGTAFNSLSSTIDNLLVIFRKFVTQDVAARAYKEKEIRLEGSPQELAILFSDIKGFTFITETLGTDIIRLLNLHYDRAIRLIHRREGIIGSIIGDALLAIFGLEGAKENKSLQAVRAAYEIQNVASELRREMTLRKEEIIKKKGGLSEVEEKVFTACLIEVGVGIDGGIVFYGNIGSYERMTNTVIGDNVNASSRLEGLTRVYKVPIICSEFVRDELNKDNITDYHFLELDKVRVKGKTIGKSVFWPIRKEMMDADLTKDIEVYSAALALYYAGDWKKACKEFKKCSLPLAAVFVERTENNVCPADWDGIWKMESK